MTYECAFDFTITKPKKSQFIGKSGVIEITTDKPIKENEMEKFKNDRALVASIANHLNITLKQKNVIGVTVKSITPVA